MPDPFRILQLSDPHLLADPAGSYRDRRPFPLLRQGLRAALRQLAEGEEPADLLLLTGDLCQDESWGGYVRLRELLAGVPLPVAALAGNHDHAHLMRAVLAPHATLAPALLGCGTWQLLLLNSHQPGRTEGWLGRRQLAWVERILQSQPAGRQQVPLLVAVHHPPVAIGDPAMDRIGLRDGEALLTLLRRSVRVRALVFGHVHQHWQGRLPGRPEVPLLGCPSSLCGFGPVQPCPLHRPDDPGGRLLELGPEGEIRQRLLRWSGADRPTFD